MLRNMPINCDVICYNILGPVILYLTLSYLCWCPALIVQYSHIGAKTAQHLYNVKVTVSGRTMKWCPSNSIAEVQIGAVR